MDNILGQFTTLLATRHDPKSVHTPSNILPQSITRRLTRVHTAINRTYIKLLFPVSLIFLNCFTMNKRALRSFETSGTTRPTTQRRIPEDLPLQK